MPLETFTIDQAIISVFPTDAGGLAITSDPIWLGQSVTGVEITEEIDQIIDRPSGELYPEVHHGAVKHEVSIERLWEVMVPLVDPPEELAVTLAATDQGGPLASNGIDYKIRTDRDYVMVILWVDDEDERRNHFRIYYGVRDKSHGVGGRSATGKRSQIVLTANYYLS
jgi:hypothetical protein